MSGFLPGEVLRFLSKCADATTTDGHCEGATLLVLQRGQSLALKAQHPRDTGGWRVSGGGERGVAATNRGGQNTCWVL